MAGFDIVSNNLGLVLFSVVFDLVIWFGPRLRISRLLDPVLDQTSNLAGIQDAGTIQTLRQGSERLNLLAALRTFPVGIPSLMVGRLSSDTPLNLHPLEIEVISFSRMLGLWGLLLIIGIALGTFYFSMIAQASTTRNLDLRQAMIDWPHNFIQVLFLTAFMFGLIALFFIPLSCLLSGLMLFGIGMSQLPLVVALFFSAVTIWIMIPLFFSPHGIFVSGRSMWQSMLQAVRMSRVTFSSTAMFILVIVLLSEGLNVVWNLPKDGSWFLLIGITGHAFITAGLLAATFIFYRDANVWLSELVQLKELNQTG